MNFYNGTSKALALAFSIEYQRDDLEIQKQQSSSRTVGFVNATYNVSEKLTITMLIKRM